MSSPSRRVASGRPSVAAHAKNRDTHVTGAGHRADAGLQRIHLAGQRHLRIVTALGTCWAVTVMGRLNTVVADTIINDIVYGWDEVLPHRIRHLGPWPWN